MSYWKVIKKYKILFDTDSKQKINFVLKTTRMVNLFLRTLQIAKSCIFKQNRFVFKLARE